MCTFYDPKNDLIIRDVPKGGSTTLRAWYGAYVYGGQIQIHKTNVDGYVRNGGSNAPRLIQDKHYHVDIYKEVDAKEKIAVKRDPVDRFVSCFVDKVVREQKVNCGGFDDFINNFDKYVVNNNDYSGWKGVQHNFVWYHFAPQVELLGPSAKEYTHVFDIKEVGTSVKEYLEDKWSMKFPALHMRDASSLKKPEVTTQQRDKIMEIYREDYEAGWC